MADAEHQELIIIKRYEEEEHEAHSSAWKVAHADFMTAMMAFFLIMWLINATDDEVKKSIANYFNPVNLAESMTDRKGLHDPEDVEAAPPPEAGKQGDAGGAASERPAAIAVVMAAREQAAFQDPYAILAKLAAEADAMAPEAGDIDAPEIQTGEPGDPGGDTARDPFDPVYWQTNATRQSRTENPGRSGTIANARIGAEIDAAARASDASATAADGEVGDSGSEPPAAATGAADGPDAFANEAFEGGADAAYDGGPHLEIRRTAEGTLVSLTDDINFSMFAVGSAIPDPQTVKAMEEIAKALSTRSGEIVIRGYTDARPFRSETYDNWRLSTARAHMAQYMLVRGGLQEDRIRSVEGFADRDLKNAKDPNAAENRRIEILLRAPAAEAPR
ncbi:MotB family protein [Pseudoxanthobacter sp. M-2]|uniref:MotB family protein n=1 Tax=Pseudoxanthobacter sp. M-2 TaxID=3078754 RepID=UPI0038FCFE91